MVHRMSPSPRQDIRTRLDTAREQWKKALRDLAAWEEMYKDGGAQHPDGVVALRNARVRLELAGARFRECLDEFTEHILRQR